MSSEKDQNKEKPITQDTELRTEPPLSEKDEQNQAIERTAELQKEVTKRKRKRISRDKADE